MSTRGRVIITKGDELRNLYHHHDCYPSGLGQRITEWMKDLKEMEDKDNVLSDIDAFRCYLEDCDGSFEYEEDYDGYHGDEEYGYYIDLDKQTVTCKDVWDEPFETLYETDLWAEWDDETMDK